MGDKKAAAATSPNTCKYMKAMAEGDTYALPPSVPECGARVCDSRACAVLSSAIAHPPPHPYRLTAAPEPRVARRAPAHVRFDGDPGCTGALSVPMLVLCEMEARCALHVP